MICRFRYASTSFGGGPHFTFMRQCGLVVSVLRFQPLKSRPHADSRKQKDENRYALPVSKDESKGRAHQLSAVQNAMMLATMTKIAMAPSSAETPLKTIPIMQA